MRKPQSHNNAATGGALKQQLAGLLARIEGQDAIKRRLTHRQRTAIESVRRYICGELGVKAADVSDKDVAAMLLKIDWGFAYRNNFYIGHQTLEETQVWATDLLAGREVAK